MFNYLNISEEKAIHPTLKRCGLSRSHERKLRKNQKEVEINIGPK